MLFNGKCLGCNLADLCNNDRKRGEKDQLALLDLYGIKTKKRLAVKQVAISLIRILKNDGNN